MAPAQRSRRRLALPGLAVLAALFAVGACWLSPASANAAGPPGAVTPTGSAAGSAAPSVAGSSADASDQGWLRLAHLSPDEQPLDVYLYAAGHGSAQAVLRGVAYGTATGYHRVDAGEDRVAVRPAGAPAGSPPLLATSVTVGPGAGVTVVAMGPAAAISLRALPDQLPPAGAGGSVRVLQASTRVQAAGVAVVGGPELATGLRFAAVTGYQPTPAGRIAVRVVGGPAELRRRITVAAGSVHTLVVLDRPAGGFALLDLSDAASASAEPTGGVDAGLGGLAGPRPPSPGSDGLGQVLVWTVPALLIAGGLVFVGVRARHRSTA